jgi:hypothetical protein
VTILASWLLSISLVTSPAHGWASWYRDPHKTGDYAAAPWYRWGDTPVRVRVCATTCTTAVVSDFCACGPRHGEPTVIDLAPSVFGRLAPLSQGVVRVTVTGGPAPTLPPTDTAP